MFWVIALVSLNLAAAPAVTKQPAATKSKTPVKAPAKSAAKPVAKTVAKAPPAKAPPAKAPVKTPAARGTTSYRAPAATTARNRTQQPQYSRYNTRRNAPARPRPVYRPVPTVPTSERTREIQTALAQRGYLTSEPSGAWDPDSTAAMKRFQQDQNLDADGKIGSLSLIALGLGPKRTVTASTAPPPSNPSTPSTTNPIPPRP